MRCATAQAPRATRREWIGLGVIALPCMLYSMDLTVLNLAVPQITAELRPTAAQMLWIIDIYGFMVAGLLITMGTLGDRIGRRRLLLIGAAAFGAASILAAFAHSAEVLILARAVLGIAGATLAPSTLSLISTMFRDERERSFAISMWIASFSTGAMIGPLVGGLLLEVFWWGAVFLAGVPVMLLLLALGPWLLPEYRDPRAGRLDVASALLSLATVLPLVYGVKRLAEHGPGWQPLAAMAAGIAIGAVFVRRQQALADPMVDLRLFRSRPFSASLAINMIGMFFMFGAFVFIAQYLQLVAGLSPLEAGLWSLPSAAAFTLMSTVTPMLAGRFRAVDLMAAGLAVAAIGFVMLASASRLPGIVTASVVFSVGFTPVVALTTGLVLAAAPPERAGTASAMSETAAELGGALGIALLGSLSTAIYRSRMAEVALDALPPAAADAARMTLSAAVAAAEALPEATADALLAPARAAFILGLQASAIMAALASVGAAALSLAVLHHTRAAAHR